MKRLQTGPTRYLLARAGLLICLGLSLLMVSAATAGVGDRYVTERYWHTVNSNSVLVKFECVGEPPEWMAVVAEPAPEWDRWEERRAAESKRWQAEMRTNRSARPPAFPMRGLNFNRDGEASAKWIPFQRSLLVDLGPGDGTRHIKFGYRYKGQTKPESWSGSKITVVTAKPAIWIVNPTNVIQSQPVIQLQGYSSRRLHLLQYDRYDERGQKVLANETGFPCSKPTTGGYPFEPWEDNYFTCFDVELSPGTNTLVLRCRDDAGNSIATNLVYVFTTAGDKTPPMLELHWPRPGMTLTGESFTARGQSDDATATMAGFIVAQGRTNRISGFPERNGYFWFEEIPLALGENRLTLTATDVAGNCASTNLVVYGCGGPVITLDNYDPQKLWNSHIRLTGKVVPAKHRVWINGVEAVVKPDGSWLAERVPVLSPSGGTAVFDMTAFPPEESKVSSTQPQQFLRTDARLGSESLTLNASAPACGTFQLQLTGTEGRPFVLLTSTNLTDWVPLFTNSAPRETFEFQETGVTGEPCRFYRVLPLQPSSPGVAQ